MTNMPALIDEQEHIRLAKAMDEASIPTYMQIGMINFVVFGIPPGNFLYAILTNDLIEVCKRADLENQKIIHNYVRALYNGAPLECWGTEENVKEWLEKGAELRRQSLEEKSLEEKND